MRHRATSRYIVILLACALASACATGGSPMKRIALAAEQVAIYTETFQLVADALESTTAITKAQRDALSPHIIAVAQADQALARAVVSGNEAAVQGHVIGVLAALDAAGKSLTGLSPDAKARLTLALDAVRSVVLLVSIGAGVAK